MDSVPKHSGEPIGDRDTLVAGTCLRFACPSTRNTANFGRIGGLDLEPLPDGSSS